MIIDSWLITLAFAALHTEGAEDGSEDGDDEVDYFLDGFLFHVN